MGILISILITFLVVVLILWLVQRLPVEGRVKQIIQIVVIIIGIIALLKYLAVFSPRVLAALHDLQPPAAPCYAGARGPQLPASRGNIRPWPTCWCSPKPIPRSR